MFEGIALSGQNPSRLQKQDKHHHRRDIADHDHIDLLAPEGMPAAFHFLDDKGRSRDPADEDGGQKRDKRHHDAVADIVHHVEKLSGRAIGQ